MALGLGAPQGDDLGAAMGRLTELWRTVGYGSVNDQPVKQPTETEAELLRGLLDQARTALKGA